jgi:hypothetical protein
MSLSDSKIGFSRKFWFWKDEKGIREQIKQI